MMVYGLTTLPLLDTAHLYAFWLAVRGSYLSRPWRTCYERWTRNRWRTPLPPSQSTSWFQWDSTGWLEFTRSPDFFPNDSQYFSIITWCISQWTNGMVYSDVEVTTTYYNYIRDMDRYGAIMCNHDRQDGVLTWANISLEIPSSVRHSTIPKKSQPQALPETPPSDPSAINA